jgi:hypothetical protein
MRIAKLNMDPTEKTKFEIIGKSSVKYSLKANHEVEAKRWFWALNNSIQWSKDQAKEEEKRNQEHAESLRQARAQYGGKGSSTDTATEVGAATPSDTRRNSEQSSRIVPSISIGRAPSQRVGFVATSAAGSVGDDEETGTAYGSYEPSFMGEFSRVHSHGPNTHMDADDDDEEYGEEDQQQNMHKAKDAFDITAQSAKLQLDMMTQVNTALQAEQTKNPAMAISDPAIMQAISTYDGSVRSLKGLLQDLLRISKDRDAYWQNRLEREAEMRRMWEESMAKVAKEQEELEARMGESELKRKMTKRTLREAIESASRPESRGEPDQGTDAEALEAVTLAGDGTARRRKSTISQRRKSIAAEMVTISDSDSEDDEEFFDAVDAGEVEVSELPPPSPPAEVPVEEVDEKEGQEVVLAGGVALKSSFHGYEDGIRKRLKMDADNRPKISLWVCIVPAG